MKVIQVVPHVGNEASGPSYSVVGLAQSLANAGDDVLLLSVKDGLLPESTRFKHQIFPKSKFPGMLWRSPGLYRALKTEALNSDVIHSHSMWVMPNVYPGWVAQTDINPVSRVAARHDVILGTFEFGNEKAIVLASVAEEGRRERSVSTCYS